MSKFPFPVLQKRVFPFVAADSPDIIQGAVFGEDVALTRVGGDILASHVDPIVGAISGIGWLAVHVACNDIAASGIPPRWVLLLVLVPRPDDEALVGQIMCDAARAAEEIGVSIIGGHTGHTIALSRPLVAVTAFGPAQGRQPIGAHGARVGDQVVVTKGVALEGTAILAHDFADTARRLGLSEPDLVEARRLMAEVSVVSEAMALADQGAMAMHDVTRGGLLETLLEVAHRSGVGLEIDAGALPACPVVARFAKSFQFDPLRMISSGTLVATLPPGRLPGAQRALEALGVRSACVGRVVPGSGVQLLRGGEVEHWSEFQCEADELARLWALYPRH